MSKLKITEGKIKRYGLSLRNKDTTIIIFHSEALELDIKELTDTLDLYADAHNTYTQCNLLPSELLADLNKYRDCLNEANKYYPSEIEKITIEREQLRQQNEELKEALQYFVYRVEAGTIRSQTTYEKYKTILTKYTK